MGGPRNECEEGRGQSARFVNIVCRGCRFLLVLLIYLIRVAESLCVAAHTYAAVEHFELVSVVSRWCGLIFSVFLDQVRKS